MSELKQSINRTQIVGTLKEMNLEQITKEVTLKGANGVEKKVTCSQMAKKEFKNPMFTIEVNGSDIGVDFFPVAEKKLDEHNNIVDNPRFKSLKTVFESYIPKCKDSENATRVKIDGSLVLNEYADKNTYEPKAFPQLNGFQITSSNVPENDCSDCEISGVIKSIIDETKGENAEPTGRLKVELATFNNLGELIPFTFIVEEDLASDFNSYYENGNSVKLYYEVIVKQVGGKKTTTGGFGRRESNMVSGFSVTEYSVFRGDEPFAEENDYFVDIDTVKKALEEREIKIANMIKKAKEDKGNTKPTTSPRNATAPTNANPFGGSATPTSATPKKNPFA